MSNRQDPAFELRQLVDEAVRAPSPGEGPARELGKGRDLDAPAAPAFGALARQARGQPKALRRLGTSASTVAKAAPPRRAALLQRHRRRILRERRRG